MTNSANENVPRRRRAAGPRTNRRAVTYTDDELADVTASAGEAGLALAAWIGKITVAAARDFEMPAPEALRELLRAVISVGTEAGRQGNNLNQAVTELHSVGAVPAVQQRVQRAAARTEEVMGEVHAAIAAIRERM